MRSRLEGSLNDTFRASETAVGDVEADLARALARNEHLSERCDEAEHRLVELLKALIAATQAESARIALLIDTVQSSRVWRLKRRLAGLLGRGRG